MKLTETRLKQMILEELLHEGAKSVGDLPNDVFVKVSQRTGVFVQFTDKNGNVLDKTGPIWGTVHFNLKNPEYGFGCDGAAVVAETESADGWGPLLYDIAIEIATIKANGLTSDRYNVQPSAQNVWYYYYENRDDVKSHQLPGDDRSLPPEKRCGQDISKNAAEYDGVEWNETPLSKRYTKNPTTLKQLGSKLILKNITLST